MYIGESWDNRTYLADPRSGNTSSNCSRKLGFVSRSTSDQGSQGTVVQVNVSSASHTQVEASCVQVSLYLLGSSTQVIRVMDGYTYDVVGRSPMLDLKAAGGWYHVQYHRSIRLRVMPVHGVNNIAAVAFRTC